ncbi:MAG: FKBP-type peptidyl-prolyl cis-trans isomerase [Saprospiraceae bacterium]|nr:FKBP-type peptidyl-prolyl cis-trans isomerase [Candidatus Brachybacter algidus]
MKNLSFFILLLLSVSIISCKKDENGGVSKNGYSYTLFKTGEGEIIKTNDLVFFDMVIMHKDSVLQDSKSSPQQPEFLMPPDSLMTSPNPVVDALKLMRKGDSIVIRERIDTMPKENFPPNMKEWKEITYTIKVKNVVGESEKKVVRDMEPAVEKLIQKDIADYKAGTIKDLKTTATGLKYVMHTEGSGPTTQKGETAKVYYYGATLADAKKFDASYAKGTAFSFPVGAGRVIQGWEEALLLMKKGDKATFFIPGNLAYGKQGIQDMIPPDAELAFYIESIK